MPNLKSASRTKKIKKIVSAERSSRDDLAFENELHRIKVSGTGEGFLAIGIRRRQ